MHYTCLSTHPPACLLPACPARYLQSSLFPVLLLLSRLYPSPLDEANSPTSLKPFPPLLIRQACVTAPLFTKHFFIPASLGLYHLQVYLLLSVEDSCPGRSYSVTNADRAELRWCAEGGVRQDVLV